MADTWMFNAGKSCCGSHQPIVSCTQFPCPDTRGVDLHYTTSGGPAFANGSGLYPWRAPDSNHQYGYWSANTFNENTEISCRPAGALLPDGTSSGFEWARIARGDDGREMGRLVFYSSLRPDVFSYHYNLTNVGEDGQGNIGTQDYYIDYSCPFTLTIRYPTFSFPNAMTVYTL